MSTWSPQTNTGKVYASNFVTVLSARKSTQNLYVGFSSSLRVGKSMAGADHG